MFSALKTSKSPSPDLSATIQRLAETAMEQGYINRKTHLMLASAMLGARALSSQERSSINRVFDSIRMGQIRIQD